MITTKEFILVECLKLFLGKSFKDVTLKEIVETTGLSKGAFYHYFNTKETLFLEVIDKFFTRMLVFDYGSYSKESLYSFYHDHIADLEKVMLKLSDSKTGMDEESIPDFNYLYPLFDALRMIPEYRKKIQEARQYELEQWTRAVERAFESGEIKSSMTGEQLAKMFIFSGNGISLDTIMNRGQITEITGSFITLWDAFYESLKA